MQKMILNNETSGATGNKKNMRDWHRPVLSRIDIKRTMSGSPGAVDAIAGRIPS
jgi:hypothetical protein